MTPTCNESKWDLGVFMSRYGISEPNVVALGLWGPCCGVEKRIFSLSSWRRQLGKKIVTESDGFFFVVAFEQGFLSYGFW